MLAREWLARLEGLTRSQVKAWSYIVEYVKVHHRRCFTYNDLIRFWPSASTRINVQTLDRRIRELVGEGLLERFDKEWHGRRRAVFCLPEDLFLFYSGSGGGGL